MGSTKNGELDSFTREIIELIVGLPYIGMLQ